MIDLDDPLFSREQALKLTRIDMDTFDNWVRYGHVVPRMQGKRRRWSTNNLIHSELTFSLAYTFKVPPKVGREIATLAADAYRQHAQADLVDIWSGSHFASLPDGDPGRMTFDMVRADGDVLRPFEPGDSELDGVMIVLPTRLLARSLLAKIKAMIEAPDTAAPSQAQGHA